MVINFELLGQLDLVLVQEFSKLKSANFRVLVHGEDLTASGSPAHGHGQRRWLGQSGVSLTYHQTTLKCHYVCRKMGAKQRTSKHSFREKSFIIWTCLPCWFGISDLITNNRFGWRRRKNMTARNCQHQFALLETKINSCEKEFIFNFSRNHLIFAYQSFLFILW